MTRLVGGPGVSWILIIAVYKSETLLQIKQDPFNQSLNKALSEFWSHETGTDWYRRHPVFQATYLQINLSVWYHVLTLECLNISFSCGDLIAPKVNDPEWVIPLRLFGDGAESYSDLIIFQKNVYTYRNSSCQVGPTTHWSEENKNLRFYPWSCLLSLTLPAPPWTHESCGMAQTSLGVACWASEHPNPQVYKYKYVFIYIFMESSSIKWQDLPCKQHMYICWDPRMVKWPKNPPCLLFGIRILGAPGPGCHVWVGPIAMTKLAKESCKRSVGASIA